MKLWAAAGIAFSVVAWAATASAENGAKLCDKPRQMEGFKTCADVGKAEQEGEVVIYATNPEQAELKVLARFSEMFPKIKPTYLRLQAGALMLGYNWDYNSDSVAALDEDHERLFCRVHAQRLHHRLDQADHFFRQG